MPCPYESLMTPDNPTPNPHDEDPPSRIFDETRPSTLARTIPKTEAEMPQPLRDEVSQTQPIVEPDNVPNFTISPDLLDEFAALNTPPEPVTLEATEAQVTFESQPNPALALTFSPAPDAPFQSSVTVGIRCAMPDARIFYTTDGSEPTENSTAYDKDKILLTESAILTARAFSNDKTGPTNSAEYVVSKPLWQENEPADPTDPTPHKISDNLMAPDGWHNAAASVRGKLHAHRALWREDAFAFGSAENAAGSWSIVIVSDGAGSAPLSRVGANVACQAATGDLAGALGEIETLSDDINADLPRIKAALVGAAQTALQFLRDEADKRQQPLNAFAATLLILVRRAYHDKQLCAALQVGDGAIALDCESGLKLLGAADHGQHSSETRFLTTNGMEADFVNRVKFSLPADLRATLVVSDGVSDDYFPEDKRLTEVFDALKPLAQSAEDAGAALLEWLGYEKKGSSDDRTLVLSWPQSAPIEAQSAPIEAQSAPIEAQSAPIEAQSAPIEAQSAPIEAQSAPIEAQSAPIEAQSAPIEAQSAPIEAQSAPIEAQSAPIEAQSAPIEAQSAPIEAQSAPIEAQSAPIEAQSATASASPAVADDGATETSDGT